MINTHYFPNEIGGAEKSIRILAEELVKNSHDVIIITRADTDSDDELNGVKVLRRRIRNIGSGSGLLKKILWHLIDTWNPFSINRIARIIKDYRPDIVHTNNLSGFSVSIWAIIHQLKIPIVHTLRDYYLLCPNTAMYKNSKSCSENACSSCQVLSAPRLTASKYIDAVIGNSQFILEKHLQYKAFPNASAHVIHNAYRPLNATASRHLAENQPVTFGYIGRLVKAKGLELLIKTFIHLQQKIPSLQLKLLIAGVGSEKYSAFLKRLASEGKRIEFIGHVEPEYFYNQINIAVVPSLWEEPLSRIIFESFAHGIPVIASANGGSPELIGDGVNGWLFETTNPENLFSIMQKLLNDLNNYPYFSENALLEARHFLPEVILHQYMKTYEAVIAKY